MKTIDVSDSEVLKSAPVQFKGMVPTNSCFFITLSFKVNKRETISCLIFKENLTLRESIARACFLPLLPVISAIGEVLKEPLFFLAAPIGVYAALSAFNMSCPVKFWLKRFSLASQKKRFDNLERLAH